MADRPGFTIAWLEARPPGDLELARSLLPAATSIELIPLTGLGLPAPEDRHRLGEADALLVQRSPISEALLSLAPRVRLVQLYGVRDERIDKRAAKHMGIEVATTHLRGCVAVAELAMTLILALSKNLVQANRLTAEGAYEALGLEPVLTNQTTHAFQWLGLAPLFEVSGKKLGIFGLGEIGTELCLRARSFGMEVLYNKRSRLPVDSERRLGIAWREPDDLLRDSDFVTLALPYSDEVRNLISRRELALMQPSSYLVNVARGPLVDELALVEALDRGEIAGAGLDVFVKEPLPKNSPLAGLDKVILTPHIGGGSGGARVKQLADVLGNIAKFADRERSDGHARKAGGLSRG